MKEKAEPAVLSPKQLSPEEVHSHRLSLQGERSRRGSGCGRTALARHSDSSGFRADRELAATFGSLKMRVTVDRDHHKAARTLCVLL